MPRMDSIRKLGQLASSSAGWGAAGAVAGGYAGYESGAGIGTGMMAGAAMGAGGRLGLGMGRGLMKPLNKGIDAAWNKAMTHNMSKVRKAGGNWAAQKSTMMQPWNQAADMGRAFAAKVGRYGAVAGVGAGGYAVLGSNGGSGDWKSKSFSQMTAGEKLQYHKAKATMQAQVDIHKAAVKHNIRNPGYL